MGRERAPGRPLCLVAHDATVALNRTKDLKLVAARLGHANAMLVLKTYGHLLPGLDRRMADEPGSAIKRPRRELREGAE